MRMVNDPALFLWLSAVWLITDPAEKRTRCIA